MDVVSQSKETSGIKLIWLRKVGYLSDLINDGTHVPIVWQPGNALQENIVMFFGTHTLRASSISLEHCLCFLLVLRATDAVPKHKSESVWIATIAVTVTQHPALLPREAMFLIKFLFVSFSHIPSSFAFIRFSVYRWRAWIKACAAVIRCCASRPSSVGPPNAPKPTG